MLRSILATRKSKRKFKLIMRVANSIMQHDEDFLDEEYIDPVTLDSCSIFRTKEQIEYEEEMNRRNEQYRQTMMLEPLPF